MFIYLLRDPEAGKDWGHEKRVTEDDMVDWHYPVNGHEFEQRRWWRTGKPGMLQSMGSQSVRHDWAAEQQQLIDLLVLGLSCGTLRSSPKYAGSLIAACELLAVACGISSLIRNCSLPESQPLNHRGSPRKPFLMAKTTDFKIHTLILFAKEIGTGRESCGRTDYSEPDTSEEGEHLKLYLLERTKARQKLRSSARKGGTCGGAKSLQSCPTLCDPMDCSPPGSSVHGILQAPILAWGAIPFFRGSSQGWKLLFPALTSGPFTASATWEAQEDYRQVQMERTDPRDLKPTKKKKDHLTPQECRRTGATHREEDSRSEAVLVLTRTSGS